MYRITGGGNARARAYPRTHTGIHDKTCVGRARGTSKAAVEIVQNKSGFRGAVGSRGDRGEGPVGEKARGKLARAIVLGRSMHPVGRRV